MKSIEVDITLRVPPSYVLNFVTVSEETMTIDVSNLADLARLYVYQ